MNLRNLLIHPSIDRVSIKNVLQHSGNGSNLHVTSASPYWVNSLAFLEKFTVCADRVDTLTLSVTTPNNIPTAYWQVINECLPNIEFLIYDRRVQQQWKPEKVEALASFLRLAMEKLPGLTGVLVKCKDKKSLSSMKIVIPPNIVDFKVE